MRHKMGVSRRHNGIGQGRDEVKASRKRFRLTGDTVYTIDGFCTPPYEKVRQSEGSLLKGNPRDKDEWI